MDDMGKRYPSNNPWNSNPCFGIWARKNPHLVTEDSWGIHDKREMYWSVYGDYDSKQNIVHLHPYSETIKNCALWFRNVLLRPEFVFERFEWLGHGAPG